VYLVCVCVFAFDLCVVFIVFILVPRRKSREFVKIGPHPRGHPTSLIVWPTVSGCIDALSSPLALSPAPSNGTVNGSSYAAVQQAVTSENASA
jgi:hypothetical protein